MSVIWFCVSSSDFRIDSLLFVSGNIILSLSEFRRSDPYNLDKLRDILLIMFLSDGKLLKIVSDIKLDESIFHELEKKPFLCVVLKLFVSPVLVLLSNI